MAELSYAARKKLPSKDFIFPKTKGYPIPDKAHARAALQAAGGARSGKPASPAKKRKIRAAVHRKFPSLGGNLSEMA
jgi:hypothetical protein